MVRTIMIYTIRVVDWKTTMHERILKLDIGGRPIRWVSCEEGALLYCRNQVAWVAGEHELVYPSHQQHRGNDGSRSVGRCLGGENGSYQLCAIPARRGYVPLLLRNVFQSQSYS